MLHSAAGARVDAPQPAGDAPVHQLTARLALRFAASGSGTAMRVEAQEPPWKVVRAFPQSNGGTLVHLHNVSGGVLGGDRLALDLDVGPGATAQVTSTGATRVYRHRAGGLESEQRTVISVAEGGLLEYLPDALIPFSGSRHVQRTVVTLADGACFFWWEILAPGRQAMGESFAFESLRIETTVRSATRPLLVESFRLEPARRSMQSVARLGDYRHTASFYAMAPGRPVADWRALEGQCNDVADEISRPGVMIWGASALASDGVMVRGLSATARDLPATLVRFWDTARRFLTGEAAVPPRKIK